MPASPGSAWMAAGCAASGCHTTIACSAPRPRRRPSSRPRLTPTCSTPCATMSTTIALWLWPGFDLHAPNPNLPELIRGYNAAQDRVEAVLATPHEYLQAQAGAALPEVYGDFNPLFTGCYAARIRVKQRNRELENKLFAAETLLAVNWAEAGAPDAPVASLEAAWEPVLFNQSHDSICGSHIDASYQGICDRFDHADRIVGQAADQRLDALMARVDTRRRGRAGRGGQQPRLRAPGCRALHAGPVRRALACARALRCRRRPCAIADRKRAAPSRRQHQARRPDLHRRCAQPGLSHLLRALGRWRSNPRPMCGRAAAACPASRGCSSATTTPTRVGWATATSISTSICAPARFARCAGSRWIGRSSTRANALLWPACAARKTAATRGSTTAHCAATS